MPGGQASPAATNWAWVVIIGNGLAGIWALLAHKYTARRTRALWWFIGLARRFRELAGFTDNEVEEIAEVSLAALNERKAFVAQASATA